tara:strand:- start:791 stop:1579 length:789 start_codon:yes stop_codon:yes gene_type:complete
MKIKQFLNFKFYSVIALAFLLNSCASKKKILYLQNIDTHIPSELSYVENNIQVNDIIDIKVSALVPEAALPYNKSIEITQQSSSNLEIMKLNGYLVSKDKTINFPVLGRVSVLNKTISDLENYLKKRLSTDGLLIDPIVTARLLNAKVTLLGEVNSPGTYNFTENNMSFLQALGLAGDLNINANRRDIIIIRNVDNKQIAANIDLTSTEWLNGPYASVKSNDIIIVNPNGSKIKSSGFFGNAGSFVSIASLLISTASFIINN